LLLVSHDRAFLDNVVTSVFVLEGNGEVQEFIGGYTDWMAYSEAVKKTEAAKKPVAEKSTKPTTFVAPATPKKKLSFKEQQELEKLPALIDQLETRQTELTQQISNANFYKQDQAVIAKTLDELKQTEEKLEQTFKRWDELEAQKS